MIETVEKYNNYLESIPVLIKKSYYKAEYFIQNLNLSEATYYRKLRENAFTFNEVTVLTKLLFPEEVILKHLRKSEEDIKQGRIITHEEAKSRLKSKYSF
ncbi:MAG: hypothetical protein ACWIPJ_05320 [Polaribacter sp.]